MGKKVYNYNTKSIETFPDDVTPEELKEIAGEDAEIFPGDISDKEILGALEIEDITGTGNKTVDAIESGLGKGLDYLQKKYDKAKASPNMVRPGIIDLIEKVVKPAIKTQVGHGAIRTLAALPDLGIGIGSKIISQLPGAEKFAKPGWKEVTDPFTSIFYRDRDSQPMTMGERLQGIGVPKNISNVVGLGADIYLGGKIGGQISKGLKTVGHKVHRLGFNKVNELARQEMLPAFSDVLFEHKWKGKPSSLFKGNIGQDMPVDWSDFQKRFDVVPDQGDLQRYMTQYSSQADDIISEVGDVTRRSFEEIPIDQRYLNKKLSRYADYDGKLDLGKIVSESDDMAKLVDKAENFAKLDKRLAWLPNELRAGLEDIKKLGKMDLEELTLTKRYFQKLAGKYKTAMQEMKGTNIMSMNDEFYKELGHITNKAIKTEIANYSPKLAETYNRTMNKMAVMQEMFPEGIRLARRGPGKFSSFEAAGLLRGHPELAVARESLALLENVPFTTKLGLNIFNAAEKLPAISGGAKAIPYAVDPESGGQYSPVISNKAKPYGM